MLRLNAALNAKDLAAIDDCVTPDFVELRAGARSGPEGLRDWLREVYRTVREPRWQVLGLVAEGTTVVLRVLFTGIDASGAPISVEQAHFYEVRDERLAIHHVIQHCEDECGELTGSGKRPAASVA
ncbi:nuclear transport factor 2 family protein [Amycolatopsis anabasis]|uniref:nuclear transport factor 2 family protein n=1 Tax=Amycolatopsis anabasis TaxID=1840409 RepID=UPI00131E4475|nr:nuclear transport factor 2 family protein [Amycolatopsis anabasis]